MVKHSLHMILAYFHRPDARQSLVQSIVLNSVANRDCEASNSCINLRATEEVLICKLERQMAKNVGDYFPTIVVLQYFCQGSDVDADAEPVAILPICLVGGHSWARYRSSVKEISANSVRKAPKHWSRERSYEVRGLL